MKSFFLVGFCAVSLISKAQTNLYAKLQLVYPVNLTYDTLLVKDANGKTVSETSKGIRAGNEVNTYVINVGSVTDGSFSIYFGGSLTNVNDTLYFESRGKDLVVDLKDSFALRDRIYLTLSNVYNFQDLYNRYNQYCNLQMQKYDSAVKSDPNQKLSRNEYFLKAGFDFVKMNAKNPQSANLFSVFVINPPLFRVGYEEANQFYLKYLKPSVKDPRVRSFVETKIEALKHNLDEGNRAPTFSATSIHNQPINNSTLSGKNVLLIFWATWCGPCMQEIPDLKQIHEEYKGDNLEMVSISSDSDSLKMAHVVNEKRLDWIQIFNSSSMRETFRINLIPRVFLIDEKGVIIYNNLNLGEESPTSDIAELKALLKQKFKH